MNKIKAIIFFVIFLLLFFFPVSIKNLKSESPQINKDQKPLQHEVIVTLKLIQVYVTDKNGNPVTDLDQSEFELYDNSKPQKITAFEKHVIPAPESPAPERIEPQLPLEKMNRKFFLLFDFAFNNIGGITMAKKTALNFIDTQIQPKDEIGIISYSTDKGLVLHEYLTTDHSKIREVINEVGYKEALGRAGRFWEELTTEKDAKIDWMGMAGYAKKAREKVKEISGKPQYQFEVQAFSSALKDFALGLRYIPGYKHIILFSTGAPNFLMYQMADQIAPELDKVNLSASDGLNLRQRYEAMIKELASSNCPVLAVNVEGLSSRFKDLDFEESFPPPRADINPMRFLDKGGKGDSALMEMAKLSGGKYFGDTNDYEKIAQDIQHLTSSYYVLGYYINEKWDGKYQRIEVKVKRAGCNVYYQKGYFNPKPFAKYTEFEKRLHLIDLALSENPYFADPIRFPLIALTSPMKQRTNLVLLAEIPVEKMLQVSKEKMEVIMLVFDKDRNLVQQQRTEVNATNLSQGSVYYYSISYLPSGKYECRVVMRNIETGKGAVASSAIDVPKRLEPGIKLYSPLVFIPGKNAVYLNGSLPEPGEAGEEPPNLTSFYSFDPSQYFPLINEMSEGVKKLMVLMPCSIIQSQKSNMVLRAQLVDLGSGECKFLPLSVVSQQQVEDTITYQIELETGELRPGKYTLYFFAEESETHKPLSFVRSSFGINPSSSS
jgi:VWFA-related protein